MMKKVLFLFAGLTAMMAACTSNNTEKHIKDTSGMIALDTTFTPANPAPENSSNCYLYAAKKDTASLKLHIKGEELTGELNYNIFEKDVNKGTIAGEMKGDTIIADYTYDSEGLRSVRQVVFLKKEGKLYEGYGEMEEHNGKFSFVNRAKLKFNNHITFNPIACK
ncbi:transposase [Pedobacter caeni]|uniref:NlpE N-terminal domain-containing protein n=1 Tax=Pedobacter caeni TaxID=288992 RepID=A0A1M5ECV0_9SPHI|nr:transposase [Pedobacter caeni]SHF77016.1 hypothetical protein SAMN04488522_103598 [Pedobacter caeni]